MSEEVTQRYELCVICADYAVLTPGEVCGRCLQAEEEQERGGQLALLRVAS